MKQINFKIPEEMYRDLKAKKERYGLSWRGVLAQVDLSHLRDEHAAEPGVSGDERDRGDPAEVDA